MSESFFFLFVQLLYYLINILSGLRGERRNLCTISRKENTKIKNKSSVPQAVGVDSGLALLIS